MSPHLLRVVSYLCMSCGIALSPSCESSLSSAPVNYEFSVVDVELRVGVKAMAITDYAEARVLMAEAALRPTSSLRLMTLAGQIFDRLRHSDPFNARYKEEARTCRRRLSRMQRESEEVEVDDAEWRPGVELRHSGRRVDVLSVVHAVLASSPAVPVVVRRLSHSHGTVHGICAFRTEVRLRTAPAQSTGGGYGPDLVRSPPPR